MKYNNLNFIQISFFLFFWPILVIPISAFSGEETFRLDDGALSYQIDGHYLYLSNKRDNGTFFYSKYKEGQYSPSADNMPSSKVLRFKIICSINNTLSPKNYKQDKWNKITDLTFHNNSNILHIKKDQGEYIIYNPEKGFDPFERDCLPFKSVKPNYEINLTKCQNQLKKSLIQTTDDHPKNTEDEFIKIIEDEIKKDYFNRISFSKVNNINSYTKCEKHYNLESLYQYLIKQENEIQQKKLNCFHLSYKELHKELDKYRQFKNQLRDLKSSIRGRMNKILLSEDKINNIKKSISDKHKMIDAQKKIYQGNHEAHAEYGIYVFEYKIDEQKTFLKENKEIELLVRQSSNVDLGTVFIQSETSLQFDGKTGKSFFNDWIETVKDGYISINPTKDDLIPVDDFINFVIKTVKYLPQIKASNIKISKPKTITINNNLKKKYKQFKVLNSAQLNDIIVYINKKRFTQKIKKDLLDRIKKKFHDIATRRQVVYNARNDLFEKFITEINKINNDIAIQENEIKQEQKNIKQYERDISDRILLAKKEYENAKDSLKCMNEISKKLIQMIKKIFHFHLYATGNSFNQDNESQIKLFSRLIQNTLISIDSRCNVVRETIKSTVENGFLVRQESSSIELLKKYKKLSIYSDIGTKTKYRIGYVVLELETEIYTNSELLPQSFDSYINDLETLWKETENLKDKKGIMSANTDLNSNKISQTETPVFILKCGESCMKIGNKTFSFKYMRNDQLYDNISYNIKTPNEIANQIKDDNIIWQLPTVHDIEQLIQYIKSGNKVPEEIKDKRIYINDSIAAEINRYSVLHIGDDYQCKLEIIDSGDMAFLIFVSK